MGIGGARREGAVGVVYKRETEAQDCIRQLLNVTKFEQANFKLKSVKLKVYVLFTILFIILQTGLLILSH